MSKITKYIYVCNFTIVEDNHIKVLNKLVIMKRQAIIGNHYLP